MSAKGSNWLAKEGEIVDRSKPLFPVSEGYFPSARSLSRNSNNVPLVLTLLYIIDTGFDNAQKRTSITHSF